MENMMFPQTGILSSLDVDKAEAKVAIPLFNMETDWCPVATHLLYQTNVEENTVEADNPTIYSDSEKTSVTISGAKEIETKVTLQKEKYGTLKVGDEVLVIFLNGNIHWPIVAARL
ncbi:hypothetical protein PP175_05645 [Aneurinibacillus sp. Ricciae_BoGa-3]|uniref:hypothetical protein n=1 Tax=Aneurinibacillus sp. Ricciae_BoGa-3 TaxID=3022697 RepID=UPI002340577B|nr:hypothetical protein [Aneurinibacillus sp. Ricciae_BoGa-3]WCK55434.1 hypothetical protein PP175_05645 [Aneurinibacillus sp. Ricciae_BoGa-3]